MPASPLSSKATSTRKPRSETEYEQKEQLSVAADAVLLQRADGRADGASDTSDSSGDYQQQKQLAPQKRTLLVRRLPERSSSQPSSTSPLPSVSPIPASVDGRRRVFVVRRSDTENKHSLPAIGRSGGPAASHATDSHSAGRRSPSQVPPPASVVPAAVGLSSSRESRILARVSASSTAFSAFQSLLASRVSRPPASLCMTNASDEYRLRMERAAINEQEKRIARQAAAAHIDAKLTAADEEGGLPLPWEQSLRGATNHSVGVGGLFSGLYCKITQADMKEMEIVRSVKMIEEQPALATLTKGRLAGGAAKSARRGMLSAQPVDAGAHHSAAAVQLVEEAARLQQLSRLGTLGAGGGKRAVKAARQERGIEQTAAQEEDEATLRLGDLIVRGTPLFDDLEPPPTAPAAAEERNNGPETADSRASQGRVDDESSAAVVKQLLDGDLPASFLVSRSSVDFHQLHCHGDKQSAHVTLHNPTRSTQHFAFSRLANQSAFERCSAQQPVRPSFVVSHPIGHLLPLSSIDVCVTFCPPAAGLWVERWQLTHIDHDGESQQLAAVTLNLTGASHGNAAPHNTQPSQHSGAQQRHTQRSAASSSPLSPSPSSSFSDASPPSAAHELRDAFNRANDPRRLHFHEPLMARWWALWRDVRQLHRPLDRQHMQWSLSAQQIEHAIDQLPSRHSQRRAELRQRLDGLQALAAVVPAPHPTRTQSMAALIKALATALPPFASQLRTVHNHTSPPPWELRKRETERRMMEFEDSVGHMADEAQRDAAAEARAAAEQQLTDDEDEAVASSIPQSGVDPSASSADPPSEEQRRLSEERAKRREEAARVRESEQRADDEWRQRDGEYRQRLEEESRRVITGIISAFEARAGVMGSSEQPPEQMTSEAEMQLPIAFPNLVIEEPAELVDDKKKGKAVKGKK